MVTLLFWVFLVVVEAIVGSLLCCCVDIVQCLLKYVIWWGSRPQNQETTTFFQTVDRIKLKRTYPSKIGDSIDSLKPMSVTHVTCVMYME